MDIIGKFTEEELKKYDEYTDEFNEEYLQEYYYTVDLDKSRNEMDRRIALLGDAIRRKLGLSEVERLLEKNNLRALYVRNPLELVLQFCFKSNECDGAKKYGLREFVSLWNRLSEEYKRQYCPNTIERTKKGTKPTITFGDLKKYIESVSEQKEENSLATAEITSVVSSAITEIDLTAKDAEQKLNEVFKTHMDKLSSSSQSIRYYVAKYIYYIICHQIMELKDILEEFSIHTSGEVFKKYSSEDANLYYNWSIRFKLACLSGSASTSVERQRIKKNKDTMDTQDNKNEDQGDVEKDKSKLLLKELLSGFALMGTPKESEGISILLLGKNREPVQLQKSIADLTPIFAGGKKAQKHEEYVEALKTLSFSDFYSYSINLTKIYSLLFLQLRDSEELATDNHGGAYIRSILEGKCDMSRSALLMMLACVRGCLFHEEWLLENKDSLYTKTNFLGTDRVNHILNRVGYVNLGDDFEDIKMEEIYYTMFNEKKYPVAPLQALLDGNIVGDELLPFDVINMDAGTASEMLYEEISRGR